MSSILWLLNTVGLSSIGSVGIISLTGIASIGVAAAKMQFDSIREQEKNEKIAKEFEKMDLKKKKIDTDLFNEDQYKTNETIKKDYEQMQVDRKDKELKDYKIVETNAMKLDYKGIKVDNYKQLLLGYNIDSNPNLGLETNYIITGTTRCGKTRKNHVLLLNYLANKQGIVWIGDLKMTDFKLLKSKKNVMGYVNNIENVKEIVAGFETEFIRRQEIIDEGDYIDIDDYNRQNQDNQMRSFMLYIEEFANLSDIYRDKNGKPIGVYADIIRLARTVGYCGGRIILTTQRASVDVIIGTLKNNCSLIGMKCLNETNSKISIDSEGCERLKKSEALTVIDGNLTKIFSYNITDEMLREFTSKLK